MIIILMALHMAGILRDTPADPVPDYSTWTPEQFEREHAVRRVLADLERGYSIQIMLSAEGFIRNRQSFDGITDLVTTAYMDKQ